MRIPTPAYQTILVPLDGSDVAEYAIGHAVNLARAYHARLLLVCLADVIDAEASGLPLAAEQVTCQEAQARLSTLRQQLRGENLDIETRVIDGDEPRAALERLVEAENVQLVVMSTQGWAGMLRWVFGPDVESALNSLPVPLLLVRPTTYKIVVPLDGSIWSESAIPQAQEIARAFDAEIILLHIFQSPASDYADQLALAGQQEAADRPYEEMREILIAMRNTLRQEGIRAREHIIRSNNPAQAIVDFVESEVGVSMVVMSTHGRTGLSRLLMGSVAQKVVKNLRCPVTLVHPRRP